MPLQTVVAEWNFLQQGDLLNRKLRQLEILRLHAAPDFMPLVDEYRAAITEYLERRKSRAAVLPFGIGNNIRDRIADDLVRQLNALDARRESLRQPAAPIAASPVAGPAGQ